MSAWQTTDSDSPDQPQKARRALLAGGAVGLAAVAGSVLGRAEPASAATNPTPDWVNVKDSGATGNGSTDDTSAILAYAAGSIAVGELIGEFSDEGAQFGLPVLCLVEAATDASPQILAMLNLLAIFAISHLLSIVGHSRLAHRTVASVQFQDLRELTGTLSAATGAMKSSDATPRKSRRGS